MTFIYCNPTPVQLMLRLLDPPKGGCCLALFLGLCVTYVTSESPLKAPVYVACSQASSVCAHTQIRTSGLTCTACFFVFQTPQSL